MVAAALGSAGLPLAIINPRRIRRFAKALGLFAKTDRLDAAAIARFAETVRPPVRPLPDAEAQRLGELVARRQQLVGMMTAERNRKRQLGNARMLRAVERVRETLQEQLSVVEVEIDGAIRSNPAWAGLDALLEAAPGIGPKIARTCIAELPGLGRLNRRQIGALAQPWFRSAATAIAGAGGGRSTAGVRRSAGPCSWRRWCRSAANCRLRRSTNGCAPVASRQRSPRGDMRKLLTILDAMVRDNTPWRPA